MRSWILRRNSPSSSSSSTGPDSRPARQRGEERGGGRESGRGEGGPNCIPAVAHVDNIVSAEPFLVRDAQKVAAPDRRQLGASEMPSGRQAAGCAADGSGGNA